MGNQNSTQTTGAKDTNITHGAEDSNITPSSCMSPTPPKLCPTLQSQVGMVLFRGTPMQRSLPNDLANIINQSIRNDLSSTNINTNDLLRLLKKTNLKWVDEFGKRDTSNIDLKQESSDIAYFSELVLNRQIPIHSNKDLNDIKSLVPSKNLKTWHITTCILDRILGNLFACTRISSSSNSSASTFNDALAHSYPTISLQFVKNYFSSQTRIDIEQSVGIIISLLLDQYYALSAASDESKNEETGSNMYKELIKELLDESGGIIFDSCMWLPDMSTNTKNNRNGYSKEYRKIANFIDKLRNNFVATRKLYAFHADWKQSTEDVLDMLEEIADNLNEKNIARLVKFLLQIRLRREISHANRLDLSDSSDAENGNIKLKCATIPNILFKLAGMKNVDSVDAQQSDQQNYGLKPLHLDKSDIAKRPELDAFDMNKFRKGEYFFIGRRGFNKLNRLLMRIEYNKYTESALLRTKIFELKNKMRCRNLKAVLHTNDTISLCYAFIALQRRLQLKIVSDTAWTTFLAKGESKLNLQNAPDIETTFELILAKYALSPANYNNLDVHALTSVSTPSLLLKKSSMDIMELEANIVDMDVNMNDAENDTKLVTSGNNKDAKSKVSEMKMNVNDKKLIRIPWNMNDYLGLIDECSLLMEEYVWIYGKGLFGNLCYKKGQYGGARVRGCVDDYNMLCDIMKSFVKNYKDCVENGHGLDSNEKEMKLISKRLPERNDKFLAKDIMAWNNGWKDDAFANGKVPGWLQWLQFRRGTV